MPLLQLFPVCFTCLTEKNLILKPPVAPEQYLCISVPGTTIDITDIDDGGTFVYGADNAAFVPPQVRQAEAHLVDNMVPLANVMVSAKTRTIKSLLIDF